MIDLVAFTGWPGRHFLTIPCTHDGIGLTALKDPWDGSHGAQRRSQNFAMLEEASRRFTSTGLVRHSYCIKEAGKNLVSVANEQHGILPPSSAHTWYHLHDYF